MHPVQQDPPPQRNPPEIPHCNHKHRARDEPVARLEHGAPEVVAWREDSRPRYVRRERDEDRQETRGDARPHEEGDGVGGTENAQQREEGVEDEENESGYDVVSYLCPGCRRLVVEKSRQRGDKHGAEVDVEDSAGEMDP